MPDAPVTTRNEAGTRRRRASLRGFPIPLALIVLAAALQSLAWNLAVPPFQGPDETEHFAYIQYLAETGNMPNPVSGGATVSSEVETTLKELNLAPLVGNLTARPAWTTADLALWRSVDRRLPPGSRANGSGPNHVAQNPPLYYALMAAAYRAVDGMSLLTRVFVLRLLNGMCFLATIALTWLLAGELFGRVRWKQTLAAGVVAVQPQLAFMSSVINPDNLLVTLTTGFLLAAVRLVKHGPSLSRVLTTSGLSAAAIITHGRGLVTVPVLCAALALSYVRHRPALTDMFVRTAAALATVVVPFAVYLAFGRSTGSSGSSSLYGGQVSQLNTGSFRVGQFLSQIYQFYFPRILSMPAMIGPPYGYRQVFIETFYGTFGSLEVRFAPQIYDTLQWLSGLGLAAFLTACIVRWRTLKRAWPTVVVMLSLLFTTMFFLHYVSYRALIADAGSDPLIVGRYLLPMISLFAAAITFTVGSLPQRIGAPIGALILATEILLALAGIGMTAARFYA